MNTEKSTINNQGQLIQEALTRRIRDAGSWPAILEAWQALLAVQRMMQADGTDIAGHEWGGDCADRTTALDLGNNNLKEADHMTMKEKIYTQRD